MKSRKVWLPNKTDKWITTHQPMWVYKVYVLFNKNKNNINKSDNHVPSMFWKHLLDWKIWFYNLLDTVNTFPSLCQVKNVCASIPNFLEFNRGKFIFSLEVPIRYDCIFVLIFINVCICLPQGTKQFYLSPRRLCLLRDVCVGVSEITEKPGTDPLILFYISSLNIGKGASFWFWFQNVD